MMAPYSKFWQEKGCEMVKLCYTIGSDDHGHGVISVNVVYETDVETHISVF